MCGIAGFCNGASDWRKEIDRMNDRLYHRGPDASGVWASEGGRVVLGHRRLSADGIEERTLCNFL